MTLKTGLRLNQIGARSRAHFHLNVRLTHFNISLFKYKCRITAFDHSLYVSQVFPCEHCITILVRRLDSWFTLPSPVLRVKVETQTVKRAIKSTFSYYWSAEGFKQAFKLATLLIVIKKKNQRANNVNREIKPNALLK